MHGIAMNVTQYPMMVIVAMSASEFVDVLVLWKLKKFSWYQRISFLSIFLLIQVSFFKSLSSSSSHSSISWYKSYKWESSITSSVKDIILGFVGHEQRFPEMRVSILSSYLHSLFHPSNPRWIIYSSRASLSYCVTKGYKCSTHTESDRQNPIPTHPFGICHLPLFVPLFIISSSSSRFFSSLHPLKRFWRIHEICNLSPKIDLQTVWQVKVHNQVFELCVNHKVVAKRKWIDRLIQCLNLGVSRGTSFSVFPSDPLFIR